MSPASVLFGPLSLLCDVDQIGEIMNEQSTNDGRAVNRLGSDQFFARLASLERFSLGVLRLGLVVVLVWIGGLKFANYEADSIVPLISNSPLMSFFYDHPAPEYKHYANREGELSPEHRVWQEGNRTYVVSHMLGIVIISLGVLIALTNPFPRISALASGLLLLMACTTLSFLATTPEAWVPPLGDTAHGFPYLSGVGRLVIKDAIMLGAALVTMVDSAKSYIKMKGGLA
jgi:uncharacterized membrane protein YkgB